MTGDFPLYGRVNSIQSLGTVDGPGVRFVVFMQGCPLRCGCCHNPDTWDMDGEHKEYTPDELTGMACHYKEYFGEAGGITLSGGEPLLQADFVREVFMLCHKNGINTCLDTSGCIYNDGVEKLLCHTDRVLLDIKYASDELYRKYVGCSIDAPLKFLGKLDERGIPVTLRQVIIPGLNDNDANLDFIANVANKHLCIDKVELLAFKKICKVKYDKLGKVFAFESYDAADADCMAWANDGLFMRLDNRFRL